MQEAARGEAKGSNPLALPAGLRGLAQASHALAGTSATEGTASRVISENAICPKRSCIAVETSRGRRRSGPDLPLRHKTFEDHLVGITRRARALVGCANGPGQERTAEKIARDPRRGEG